MATSQSLQLVRKIHLLLPHTDLPAALQYLKKNGPDFCSYVQLPVEDGAAIPSGHRTELATAEVLLTTAPLLGATLYSLPRMRWVQLTFAGVDELMKFYQPDKPVPPFAVTRLASAVYSRELAEWVLTAVLGHERGFHRLRAAQCRHSWAQAGYSYRPLSKLTIGVLGTGEMGTQVGIVFKKLGCTVNGLSRTEKPADDVFDNRFTVERLSEFLRSADYLCSVLPSTAETRHLLTADLLTDLPRRPVLVNAGRGNLVSEEVLVAALRSGALSGAVLDVFEKEPLPTDSPLWDMEEVTITPHVANISLPSLACDVFLQNLARFVRRETLLYKLDWEAGY